MKKYQNRFDVRAGMEYRGEHSGTKFYYCGKFYNAGEAAECALTLYFGQDWRKDNVPFDRDSDVCAYGMMISVKSFKATLVTPSRMNTKASEGKEAVVAEYMARVASNTWAYMAATKDGYTVYLMNAEQFKTFVLSEMWSFDKKRGSIRQLVGQTKVVEYFES